MRSLRPNQRLQLAGAARRGLRPALLAGGDQRTVEFGAAGIPPAAEPQVVRPRLETMEASVIHSSAPTSMPDISRLVEYLPNILSYFAGVVSAVFADPLRRWIYRPSLSLTFGTSQDYVPATPETDNGAPYEARYIRVKVTNTSQHLAKSCRVFLVGIERLNSGGVFERTSYCDSIQVAWSVRHDQGFTAIDLPRNVPHFVDVLSTREGAPIFRPHVRLLPYRYHPLFATPGTYRFTLHAAGDDVNPATLQIVFHWTGVWNEFSVNAAA